MANEYEIKAGEAALFYDSAGAHVLNPQRTVGRFPMIPGLTIRIVTAGEADRVVEAARARHALAASDAALARGVEDVVAVLSPEQRAALPAALLNKIAERQALRARLIVE